MHLPWFADLKSAMADGKAVPLSNDTIALRPHAKEIHLRGVIKPNTPHMSCEQNFEAYKAEYSRCCQRLICEGAAKQ